LHILPKVLVQNVIKQATKANPKIVYTICVRF
jgi:hypothetical protein